MHRSSVGSNFSAIILLLLRFIWRVLNTGPGKPGKSQNFILIFSRTGKSWKKTLQVLNICLTQAIKFSELAI